MREVPKSAVSHSRDEHVLAHRSRAGGAGESIVEDEQESQAEDARTMEADELPHLGTRPRIRRKVSSVFRAPMPNKVRKRVGRIGRDLMNRLLTDSTARAAEATLKEDALLFLYAHPAILGLSCPREQNARRWKEQIPLLLQPA
jgi:hypothetical protein